MASKIHDTWCRTFKKQQNSRDYVAGYYRNIKKNPLQNTPFSHGEAINSDRYFVSTSVTSYFIPRFGEMSAAPLVTLFGFYCSVWEQEKRSKRPHLYLDVFGRGWKA